MDVQTSSAKVDGFRSISKKLCEITATVENLDAQFDGVRQLFKSSVGFFSKLDEKFDVAFEQKRVHVLAKINQLYFLPETIYSMHDKLDDDCANATKIDRHQCLLRA